MRLDLTLAYDLAEGWLAPYVDGLRGGRAMASVCDNCGTASFPPRRTCTCGGRTKGWTELPGDADIIGRTVGSDGDVVLLRFKGAGTASVARAEGLDLEATRARLVPAPDLRPALIVIGIAEDAI